MNLETTAAKYIQIWNETNAAARRDRIAELFAEACTYADPLAAVAGRAGIDALIASVQTKLPGFTFSVAGKVDAHHDVARFVWHARPASDPNAEPVVVGFDVMVTDGARITQIVGFLDKVPTH